MLVKHSSRYIRVHPCKLQLRINNLFENKDSFLSDIDLSTSSLQKGPNIVYDNFQNVKILFDNEKMFDNEIIYPIHGTSD